MKNKIYKVLLKLFGKDYTCLGFAQYFKDDNMGVFQWLKPKTVKELTDKRAYIKSIREYEKEYPEYKGYINLL